MERYVGKSNKMLSLYPLGIVHTDTYSGFSSHKLTILAISDKSGSISLVNFAKICSNWISTNQLLQRTRKCTRISGDVIARLEKQRL